MKNRAYITTYHKIIEAVAIIISVAAVIVGIVFALTAEGEVPIHFGLNGEPTAYGSAWSGFFLPIVLLVSNLGISGLLRFVAVETWNMPCEVPESYAPFAYRDCITMMVLMQLLFGIMSILGTIFMYTARNLMGPSIMICCGILMIVTGFYFVKIIIMSKRYA